MLSKVYRGYVIQQNSNNQWVIQNFPSWTTSGAISPGPHSSWTTAKHQVDKLHEFMERQNSPQNNYSSKSNGSNNNTDNSYYENDSVGGFELTIKIILCIIFGLFIILGK